jgi:hypothetical protein
MNAPDELQREEWWIAKRQPWLLEGLKRTNLFKRQKEKQMTDSIKISYKYDLMHRNTPKFARTTIQWDTKLMSPITRKRVIESLKAGLNKYGRGDAGQMYDALIRKFEIPDVVVPSKTSTGRLGFRNVPDYVWEEARKVQQVDQTITRLQGTAPSWYYDSEITRDTKGFWIRNEDVDLEPFKEACAKMMAEESTAKKVRDALMFIEDGGVIEFTYNPTDR